MSQSWAVDEIGEPRDRGVYAGALRHAAGVNASLEMAFILPGGCAGQSWSVSGVRQFVVA